jgi:CTP:molybdopterin cytidylyltransferase MocA
MTVHATPSLLVVVLAAGQASRYGTAKQLAQFQGQTLLQGAVARAVAVGSQQVAVVLGARAQQLSPLLRQTPATLLLNRDWQEGMASSLRAAAAHARGRWDGLLITLVDQPAVTVSDLQRLQTAWLRNPDSLVAASFAGTAGAPAIIPAWCYADLLALRGDQGARALLQRHAQRLLRVQMPAAALDVDTPEDLQALNALPSARPIA